MSDINFHHIILSLITNLDRLYTQIEEGLANEYDLERLKKVREEITSIRIKLDELDDHRKAQLSAKQVEPC